MYETSFMLIILLILISFKKILFMNIIVVCNMYMPMIIVINRCVI